MIFHPAGRRVLHIHNGYVKACHEDIYQAIAETAISWFWVVNPNKSIINNSFFLCVFPRSMKHSVVNPLLKNSLIF